jgi:hypothetical protein
MELSLASKEVDVETITGFGEQHAPKKESVAPD